MILSKLRSMSLEALCEAILRKPCQNEAIARARAYRVMCRLNGWRITMSQAMEA